MRLFGAILIVAVLIQTITALPFPETSLLASENSLDTVHNGLFLINTDSIRIPRSPGKHRQHKNDGNNGRRRKNKQNKRGRHGKKPKNARRNRKGKNRDRDE
uniref:Secreted protein n=1 Tax=Panagrellus redivivus TaxID=6233 RepID=A0A7E4V2I9_PANRE